MSADQIDAYADAMLRIAQAEGNIDTVEDELFRFGRALEGSESLKTSLTDEMIPTGKRQAIVEDLVGSGRGKDLPAIITKLVERAAGSKSKAVAEVRSAIALTDDQKTRLAAALANATGKSVEVKVIIDPTVLGGLVAQIGDQVIDGSVRTRLDQLKAKL
jgi:F-type H+-transporting ATPase subunit delta